jgi:hypothetical protein
MKKINICLSIVSIAVFLFGSCGRTEIKADKKILDPLPVVGEKIIEVDSLTVNELIYPQVLNYNGVEVITSINVVDNTLKLFDFNSGRIYKSLNFPKDGKDALTDLLSVHILSPDSILYLDKSSTLYLLNEKLEKVNQFSFKSEYEKGAPVFYDNILPLVKVDDYKYLAVNYYTTRLDRKLNVVIDLKLDSLVYLHQAPPEFVEGFYGILNFRSWNYVYNKEDSQFIFNFPNLDSLYVYDKNMHLIRKVDAQSRLKERETEPMIDLSPAEMDSNPVLNEDKILRQMKNSFAYSDLIFNEQLNQYYRFVGLPISYFNIDEKDPIKSEIRDYSLIVMNQNFEVVNEFLLPYNKYRIKKDGFFVKDGKLFLQKKTDIEDKMSFDIVDFALL